MAENDAASQKLPPPTLMTLVSILGTQAMVALGKIADPVSGKSTRNDEQAKHIVELLAMLETKTAGNRTPDETHLLENVLHQLRMTFVG